MFVPNWLNGSRFHVQGSGFFSLGLKNVGATIGFCFHNIPHMTKICVMLGISRLATLVLRHYIAAKLFKGWIA